MKGPSKKKPGGTGRQQLRRGAGGGPSGSGGFTSGGAEEAVRLCRAIANTLSADGFALLIAAPGASHSLKSAFDCDFPLPSPYLSAFLDVHDGELARHLLATTVPLWWCGPASIPDGLSALPWGKRLLSYGGLEPGVGFPCHAERGAKGIVVFWGKRLAVAGEAMLDAHGRCFALFEAVSLMRIEGEGGAPMSKRELECLELTAEGLTSAEIAKALGMASNTVDQHLASAMVKLNAVSRVHAVAKAIRFGLID